jgi:hypothetical protein
VSVAAEQLFTVINGLGCELPPGLPAGAARQIGNLLRMDLDGGDLEVVARLDSFECANDPDGQETDTNPYSVLALGRHHQLAADAAGNTLLSVRHGRVSLLAVFPDNRFGADAVPTSIARGPDGAYYVAASSARAS